MARHDAGLVALAAGRLARGGRPARRRARRRRRRQPPGGPAGRWPRRWPSAATPTRPGPSCAAPRWSRSAPGTSRGRWCRGWPGCRASWPGHAATCRRPGGGSARPPTAGAVAVGTGRARHRTGEEFMAALVDLGPAAGRRAGGARPGAGPRRRRARRPRRAGGLMPGFTLTATAARAGRGGVEAAVRPDALPRVVGGHRDGRGSAPTGALHGLARRLPGLPDAAAAARRPRRPGA